MSDLTATPQSSPVPAGTQSPQRVEGANHARDDTQPEEKPHREPDRRARPEARAPKAYDPAVSVAPSLAHLKPGSTVTGKIERIDGTGRPILDTREGVYALRPDAGLKPGDQITIVLDRVDRQITGAVTTRAGQAVEPPIEVHLILIGLKHLPAGPPPEVTTAPTPALGPFHYNAPAGSAGRITEFEASSLSLAPTAQPAAPLVSEQASPLSAVASEASPRGGIVGNAFLAQESEAPGAPTPSQAIDFAALEGRVISAHVARVDAATADPGLFSAGQSVLLRLSEPDGGKNIGDFAVKTDGTIVTAAQVTGTTDRQAPKSDEAPAPSAAPNDDRHHYLETPLATFVFRAEIALPLGTRLVVAIAPAEHAAATAMQTAAAVHAPAATKAEVPSKDPHPGQSAGSPPAPASPMVQPGAPATSTETKAIASPAETAGAPTAKGAAAPLPELPPTWPVLNEIYATLMQAAPDSAAAMAARVPGPQTTFSNGLLFVLATIASNLPRALIGEGAMRELERNDRTDLIARLTGEVGRLFRATGGERAAGEWRYWPIPFQTDSGINSLYLFWKPENRDQGGAQDDDREGGPKDQAKRFMIDMGFARLGRIQFDGFYRPQRLDMHVRSVDPLPADMCRDIEALFRAALEAGELTGNLDFSELRPPPVELSGLLKREGPSAPHPDFIA